MDASAQAVDPKDAWLTEECRVYLRIWLTNKVGSVDKIF